jgi:hypothetical protein
MLQLLDLAAAVLDNLPPREPSQRVLALQRIALLHSDCVFAFTDYADEDGAVASLLKVAREGYSAALCGKRRFGRVRRKADLPERG